MDEVDGMVPKGKLHKTTVLRGCQPLPCDVLEFHKHEHCQKRLWKRSACKASFVTWRGQGPRLEESPCMKKNKQRRELE